MYSEKKIKETFEKAGLRLQLQEVGSSNREIFGLRVAGQGRNEIFVMQLGHETNMVQVLDSDAQSRQVLLHVDEKEREFTTREWSRRERKYIDVPHRTIARKRKVLLGMDERQYFAAEVADNAINIRDAKDKLRNPDLKDDKKTIRQGEWFFQPVEDTEHIEKAFSSNEAIVFKKHGIGALLGGVGGKPHVADEIVRIRKERLPEERIESGSGVSIRTPIAGAKDVFYVRGKVRHPDHKTIEFSSWHRVYPNTEERVNVRTSTRMFID